MGSDTGLVGFCRSHNHLVETSSKKRSEGRKRGLFVPKTMYKEKKIHRVVDPRTVACCARCLTTQTARSAARRSVRLPGCSRPSCLASDSSACLAHIPIPELFRAKTSARQRPVSGPARLDGHIGSEYRRNVQVSPILQGRSSHRQMMMGGFSPDRSMRQSWTDVLPQRRFRQ